MTRADPITERVRDAETSGPTERAGELYLEHRDEIYRFLTGQGLPAATAQDVTQEVFLKLLVALREGHSFSSPQAWLYRVAANRAVDYWRRERRTMTVDLDTERIHEIPSAEMHLTDRAAELQRMTKLAAEIGRLPKEQRMCILLRSQGLRYREMAQILGVGVSTAADWLVAAVDRLRRVVHD